MTFKFSEGALLEKKIVAFADILKHENGMVVVNLDEPLLTILIEKLATVLNYSPRSGLKVDFNFFLEICYYFRREREDRNKAIQRR